MITFSNGTANSARQKTFTSELLPRNHQVFLKAIFTGYQTGPRSDRIQLSKSEPLSWTNNNFFHPKNVDSQIKQF